MYYGASSLPLASTRYDFARRFRSKEEKYFTVRREFRSLFLGCSEVFLTTTASRAEEPFSKSQAIDDYRS